MLHRLQTVFLAVLLLLVSSYCAAECVVGPCHSAKAADQTQAPPCHGHQEQQSQPQNDDSQNCLHSQFVMDSPSLVHMTAELAVAPVIAILPVEVAPAPQLDRIDAIALQAGPPPPWPRLVLTTSLRI